MQRNITEFHEFHGLILLHFLQFIFKDNNHANNFYWKPVHLFETSLETMN